MENERILLGMSGGVDSTYAAALLRERGFVVEGAVLKMSEHTDIDGAISAANAVGIPIHVIDCTERFRLHVIENFVSEYRAARTPNPCVVCNPTVKFAALCECAEKRGISRIATGHYAFVRRDGETGRYYLAKAGDPRKDQTYALWRLSQKQLSMLTLPLCDRMKSDVKSAARKMELPCAGLPESQEICFIPDNDYASYIEAAVGRFPEGDFLDASGRVLGRHRGILHYTIGQRKGLGIALGRPMFVSAIDPQKNTVTLSDEDAIFTDTLVCRSLHFMWLPEGDREELSAEVKIRYAAEPTPAKVRIEKDTAWVHFDRPVRAVTPGQSAVFYRDGGILFGGIIDGRE